MNEPLTSNCPSEMTIELATATRATRRKAEEGMTLVEIMIVVIIMALIATAVGVAVLPRLQSAREDSTRTDAQAIGSAATLYMAENVGGGCPTVDDLVDSGYLSANKRTTDAWDNPFNIECESGTITVISGGEDGQVGTEDDIQ